jgi:hypothetical protein
LFLSFLARFKEDPADRSAAKRSSKVLKIADKNLVVKCDNRQSPHFGAQCRFFLILSRPPSRLGFFLLTVPQGPCFFTSFSFYLHYIIKSKTFIGHTVKTVFLEFKEGVENYLLFSTPNMFLSGFFQLRLYLTPEIFEDLVEVLVPSNLQFALIPAVGYSSSASFLPDKRLFSIISLSLLGKHKIINSTIKMRKSQIQPFLFV